MPEESCQDDRGMIERAVEIGVVSDLHGNLRALSAIWEEFEARGLTQGPVLNAGDSVGYGDSPEKCVTFLREHPNILSVQGNYDKHVAKFPLREAEFQRKWGSARPEKFQALAQDSAIISDTSRKWLLDLPKELTVTIDEVRILVTHYAPGEKTGLGPWVTEGKLAELAQKAEADVVVCGHTHAAFVREAGSVLFVNPGAAGRSFGPYYPFAVLTLRDGRATASLERLDIS